LHFLVVLADATAATVSTSTAASGGTSSTSTVPLFVNHSQMPTPSNVLQQGIFITVRHFAAFDFSFTTGYVEFIYTVPFSGKPRNARSTSVKSVIKLLSIFNVHNLIMITSLKTSAMPATL